MREMTQEELYIKCWAMAFKAILGGVGLILAYNVFSTVFATTDRAKEVERLETERAKAEAARDMCQSLKK